ncbi:cytochrome P450 [Aeromicrobium sp. CnD17-E]|uniref:cytochrome P450 n=1 Tax=Aeromicrobium sp. CnD17-E TaxID=2954487 RepID=UPI00209685D0|nr:cytochrome P450 [Aeromicrobium sp. CnD17-E]MCO7240502.1 cytochrome P450 [Aeromicrobium sp. CnD17-E]
MDTSPRAGCPFADHRAATTPPPRAGRIDRRVPVYDGDLYRRSSLVDPHRELRVVRDLGSVVWLSKQRAYALTRYAEVKAALADPDAFRSADGVGLNAVSRRIGRHSLLMTDGEEHGARRRELAHRLTPRALRPLQEQIEDLADRTVRDALARGTVDGVADIALRLPLTVVPDLVGWPKDGREHLVEWAGATFDILGPLNGRSLRAMPHGLRMLMFARRRARRSDVLPGSMADEVFRTTGTDRAGRLRRRSVLVDYLAPSIDTTASAIAAALWLLATHPEEWARLKADPSLVPSAFNEVVRWESPVRAFGRRVHHDVEVDGTLIPAGSQVILAFASANRDERQWDEPDSFRLDRDARLHVGFGHGTHGCAGQGLARLETHALLHALVRHVADLHVVDTPTRAVNNVIQRLETLPLRLVPEASCT